MSIDANGDRGLLTTATYKRNCITVFFPTISLLISLNQRLNSRVTPLILV
jgi:hypothetical protein